MTLIPITPPAVSWRSEGIEFRLDRGRALPVGTYHWWIISTDYETNLGIVTWNTDRLRYVFHPDTEESTVTLDGFELQSISEFCVARSAEWHKDHPPGGK